MIPKTSLSLEYTGEIQPALEEYGKDGIYPYLPPPGLRDAVNLTMFLQKRPLLDQR